MNLVEDLNKHQINALKVLCDIGGWATSSQLHYHGVNAASAVALEKRNFLERRTIGDEMYGTSEWRINLDRLDELVDFVEEGSVYQKLMWSFHKTHQLMSQVHSITANNVLENMDESLMQ
jgi:hypothetical protein